MRYVNGLPASLLFLLLSIYSVSTWALEDVLQTLPEGATVWHNRSGDLGAEYQDYEGADIAFINADKGAWYYLDGLAGLGQDSQPENALWRRFHTGYQLDFADFDTEIVEGLAYEVLAGTPFLQNEGSARDQGLLLDGPSGDLVSRDGFTFSPEDFEYLEGQDGRRAYYQLSTGSWFSASGLPNTAISRVPKPPFKPLYIGGGSYPGSTSFVSPVDEIYHFDLETLRYLYADNPGLVAGFHRNISSGLRRWNNESDMPCAPYQGYEGLDLVFVANQWYQVEGSAEGGERFLPLHNGRYLPFQDYSNETAFLAMSLTAGMPLQGEGDLSDMGYRLDGVSGVLVDENSVALAPDSYRSPSYQAPPCLINFSVMMNDTLALSGVQALAPFESGSFSVTLMDVVPIANIENNPFDDRSVVLAINQARSGLVVAPSPILPPVLPPAPDPTPVPPPPPPPPPVGSCPLNSPLTLIAALPEGAPLANLIGITMSNQLNAGFAVPIGSEAISVSSGGSLTTGSVSVGTGYSYVSGSALGAQAEGTNLSYRLRRNSDSAEFEVDVSFQADIVFDDPGIIITSLSGRQCIAGGTL